MDNQTAYFLPLSASFTEQKQQTDEINLIFLQLLLASKMGKVVEFCGKLLRVLNKSLFLHPVWYGNCHSEREKIVF